MRLSRIILVGVLFLFSAIIAGCGGSGDSDGNSETTGILGTVNASKVGNKIFASVTYSNAMPGLSVTFAIDKESKELFDKASVEARTDSSGVASAVFTIVGVNTAKRNITISASTGGLPAAPAVVTLSPVTLTVTPPADATKEVKSTLSGIVEFVPSGFLATLTDGDGFPVQNSDVTISVQTTLSGTGTAVVFWGKEGEISGSSITIKTDSNGKVPNLATVRVPFAGAPPGAETTNVCTVVWKVTSGTLIIAYGTTQFTVNNKVPKETED